MNSPVRLGVSPAAASTPMGVFNQRFEALFPGAGALGCEVCFAPPVPPHLSMCECGAAGSASCSLACPIRSTIRHLSGSASRRPAVSPLHPGCLSPPLPLVWVSVSSLSPWRSDFHTVRFSVSSCCFLFLNCFCPSFGCVRKHSAQKGLQGFFSGGRHRTSPPLNHLPLTLFCTNSSLFRHFPVLQSPVFYCPRG